MPQRSAFFASFFCHRLLLRRYIDYHCPESSCYFKNAAHELNKSVGKSCCFACCHLLSPFFSFWLTFYTFPVSTGTRINRYYIACLNKRWDFDGNAGFQFGVFLDIAGGVAFDD